MKLFYILILTFFFQSSYSQNNTELHSTSGLKKKCSNEIQYIERDITFNENKIIVTNFLNDSKDKLELKVNSIETKVFNSIGQKGKYYYCTSITPDPIIGIVKYIVITPIDNIKKVDIYQFAYEVNVYHTQLTIEWIY